MPETISNQKLSETANEICKLISGKGGFSDYAVSYLRHIVNPSVQLEPEAKHYGNTLEYALHVQCLYALNNLTHWRHPRAKELRQVLKDYSAQNKNK